MDRRIKELKSVLKEEGSLMENPAKYCQIEVDPKYQGAFKEEFLRYVGGDRREYMLAFYEYSLLDSIYDTVIADMEE